MEQHRVFNGNGELIYTANSIAEAEEFLSNLATSKGIEFNDENTVDAIEGNSDSRIPAILLAKGVMKALLSGWTITAVVIYQTCKWLNGDADFIDVIDTIGPFSALMEMAAKGALILYYCFGGTNPYPPHSYQYYQWVRTNTYYVEG
ncbi:hypothetical protein [Clostridium celatum]|uniref:hypothetical protein n=1 Tax=Clostridium celatum TaxID=36834 RepID=UPI001898722E|nr:hypothetical protein [Clostridium celatum]